uniref:Putative secreted protein n=1 Tax=Ixodes ricinus TaxID=34613 RepID=A0A6B0UT79_IXORI
MRGGNAFFASSGSLSLNLFLVLQTSCDARQSLRQTNGFDSGPIRALYAMYGTAYTALELRKSALATCVVRVMHLGCWMTTRPVAFVRCNWGILESPFLPARRYFIFKRFIGAFASCLKSCKVEPEAQKRHLREVELCGRR